MDIRNKKINFLGDSITEGHGCADPENCFAARIARDYGAVCRNYGIGGTRIARQKQPSEKPRHDLDFVGRYADMDPDADIVAVFGGVNDFGHGDAPLGFMDDRTPYTFYGALHLLYTGLIERYPSARIVIFTPLHCCFEESRYGSGQKTVPSGLLIDYVRAIRKVAEYYSLPVLDLYAASGLQPNVPVIRERYVPDGLHPNDEGHRVLAERITAFFRSL